MPVTERAPKSAKLSYLVLCAYLIASSGVMIAAAQSSNPGISLSLKDEVLEGVIGKLSRASGYEITFNREWSDFRVSAEMEDVTIEEAVWRCLNNLNYAAAWNEKDKKLILFIRGEKRLSRDTETTEAARHDRRFGVSVMGEGTNFVQATRTDVD